MRGCAVGITDSGDYMVAGTARLDMTGYDLGVEDVDENYQLFLSVFDADTIQGPYNPSGPGGIRILFLIGESSECGASTEYLSGYKEIIRACSCLGNALNNLHKYHRSPHESVCGRFIQLF